MALKYSDVGEILKMIENSSCTEFNLETDGIKLQVRKGESLPRQTNDTKIEKTPNPSAAPSGSGELKDTRPEFSGVANEQQHGESCDSEIIVRAPMVGTFYSKPSPEEASFVKVGSNVSKGETVCLIEVMKLFTAVESDYNGVIEKVFVVDGDLVEFDQPLMLIRK